MQPLYSDINEQLAADAFSKQSSVFDALFSGNTIIQYKRQRVRKHLLQYLQPGSHILELNCGTGEDAVWLAQNGYRVHATDIASGMLHELHRKIKAHQLENRISAELCSFTQLENLSVQGPFDCIFSNFAGLNCTGKLDKVLLSFSSLLQPGGIATLVVMPPFCLWEVLLLFKGKCRTAFRRFFSQRGRPANVEGVSFTCWYYKPSFIIRHLKKDFALLSIEGLCSLVPPSYIENFPRKYPRLFRWLVATEEKRKDKWPWKYMGDYFIITLKKKSGHG